MKYVLILLSTLLFGCSQENCDVITNVRGEDIMERTIIKDNHTYYMFVLVSSHKCGLSVVHSEACQCKKQGINK